MKKNKRGRKRTRTMTFDEYKSLEGQMHNGVIIEITDTLVERVWDYKWYSMCNNAKNVRAENKSGNYPAYVHRKYFLGELKDVSKNIRLHDPELHQRGLQITRKFLESGMDSKFSPTLDRLFEHYQYGDLDIISKQEHTQKDVSKMQAVTIFTDNDGKYTLDGVLLKNSKRELAEHFNIKKNEINKFSNDFFTLGEDKVVWIKDVITAPSKPLTKEEVISNMETATAMINKYKDEPKTKESYERYYRAYRNAAVKNGWIDEDSSAV